MALHGRLQRPTAIRPRLDKQRPTAISVAVGLSALGTCARPLQIGHEGNSPTAQVVPPNGKERRDRISEPSKGCLRTQKLGELFGTLKVIAYICNELDESL